MSDAAPSLEPRVAVLEQIARDTLRTLERFDRRFETLEARMDRHFLWLLSVYLGGMGAIIGGGGYLLIRIGAKVGAL